MPMTVCYLSKYHAQVGSAMIPHLLVMNTKSHCDTKDDYHIEMKNGYSLLIIGKLFIALQ